MNSDFSRGLTSSSNLHRPESKRVTAKVKAVKQKRHLDAYRAVMGKRTDQLMAAIKQEKQAQVVTHGKRTLVERLKSGVRKLKSLLLASWVYTIHFFTN